MNGQSVGRNGLKGLAYSSPSFHAWWYYFPCLPFGGEIKFNGCPFHAIEAFSITSIQYANVNISLFHIYIRNKENMLLVLTVQPSF